MALPQQFRRRLRSGDAARLAAETRRRAASAAEASARRSPPPAPRAAPRRPRPARLVDGQRQLEPEGGALAQDARRADGATHQLDQLAGDVEYEAAAADPAAHGVVAAREPLEQVPLASGDMPTPVSRISNRTRTCPRSDWTGRTPSDTSPWSVNLIALPTRLTSTWWSCRGLPRSR